MLALRSMVAGAAGSFRRPAVCACFAVGMLALLPGVAAAQSAQELEDAIEDQYAYKDYVADRLADAYADIQALVARANSAGFHYPEIEDQALKDEFDDLQIQVALNLTIAQFWYADAQDLLPVAATDLDQAEFCLMIGRNNEILGSETEDYDLAMDFYFAALQCYTDGMTHVDFAWERLYSAEIYAWDMEAIHDTTLPLIERMEEILVEDDL